ncbi:hypothetical protein A1O7_02437 [Cladophialophora yegresii CBS 114405]|uniref:CENP-V/GFA domain-containing protein n=1 Tax=Cladophialophora yegresii CBS 114405 TaxID=1182544 RepID=W9WAJ2_9EURO|nr:uncharacterized protein A1O7_02437 [Cladophialophora yegresii CBS 114405]EXJ62005.1 hypothetical protein A1O7_02437 [Cladophialophora yegresii CBS 114405]
MDARCQCGQIRFVTPLVAPLALYICHCTECRHQSSSTYGMTAIFPYFDIQKYAPTPDAIEMYSRANSSGRTDGYFCTKCGSRLVHVSMSAVAGQSGDRVQPAAMLSVKAGCLEGLSKELMRKAIHIWTKSAVVDIPEGVEQYEEEPPGGSFAEE